LVVSLSTRMVRPCAGILPLRWRRRHGVQAGRRGGILFAFSPMPDLHHVFEEAATRDVTRALAEDMGTGDLTARLIPPERQARARLMTRENGVLCGVEWFRRTFEELDPDIEIFWHHAAGDAIVAGSSR